MSLAEGDDRVALLTEAIDLAGSTGSVAWHANALTPRAVTTGDPADAAQAQQLLADAGLLVAL